MDALPTVQSRLKKSNFQMFLQSAKRKTKKVCIIFIFQKTLGCGYFLFDKHSEGWFFAYLSKMLNPKNNWTNVKIF